MEKIFKTKIRIIILLFLNIAPLYSQVLNFSLNINSDPEFFKLSNDRMIYGLSYAKLTENFSSFAYNIQPVESNYIKNYSIKTFSSKAIYYYSDSSEADKQLYLGTGLLAAGYFLCSDKKYEGSGFLCAFMGGVGVTYPIWKKDFDNNKNNKGYFNLSGFGLAFASGIFHSASSDPDDPLGGALITTGLIILTALGSVLLF